MKTVRYVSAMAALAGVGLSAMPAWAQLEEMIVTARKKEETAIAVPVVISAFSAKELERYGSNSYEKLMSMTPGLLISAGANSTAGGVVVLRGVGTGFGNPASDQSVSINLDGVQLGGGLALRVGFTDVQQVEVLKGPQTLFFGKNSPGGILSLRTADPTEQRDASLRVGYEFYAREVKTEAMVSGKLTDKLLGRLVFSYDHSQGYFVNKFDSLTPAQTAVPGTPFVPVSVQPGKHGGREPFGHEYFVRGTLKYEGERFDMRFKGTYNQLHTNLGDHGLQRIDCPNGIAAGAFLSPASGAATDCKADNRLTTSWTPIPSIDAIRAKFGPNAPADGSPSQVSSIGLVSLEANYHLTDNLTVTSVTGGFWADEYFNGQYSTSPVSYIMGANEGYRSDISEELRIRSSFDLPINFLAGFYYQNTYLDVLVPSSFDIFDTLFGPGAGAFPHRVTQHHRSSYSGFGQVQIDLTKTLELSGGARWTAETVKTELWDQVTRTDREAAFYNLSPEITLSYRPNQDFNAFGSYRTGFKSGGFDASVNAPLVSYRPESVKGGEIGVKSRLMNGQLAITTDLYRYNYSNLQVSQYNAALNIVSVVNAGQTRTQGVDVDATYAPEAIRGLTLRGAFNYNHARYNHFIGDCYTGQSISQGCNVRLDPATGRYTQQDLSGKQVFFAPRWTATFGFNYDRPITQSGLMAGLSTDVSYTSSQPTEVVQIPGAFRKAYTRVNASFRVHDEGDAWELAVIGRNLNNVYTWINASPTVDAGLAAAGVDPMTGTAAGHAWDTFASVSRGREVWLQLTIHPFNFGR